MALKNDEYQSFLKVIEIQNRKLQDKNTKRLISALLVFVIYVLFVSVYLIQGNVLSLFPSFDRRDNEKFEQLNFQLEKIETRLNGLENATSTDLSNYNLDTRIANIEEKNSYLYKTILDDPDSAITPKILREEQENLNEKFQDLKKQVSATNNILSGILVTLLLAILGYIAKQAWGALVSKRNTLKE